MMLQAGHPKERQAEWGLVATGSRVEGEGLEKDWP